MMGLGHWHQQASEQPNLQGHQNSVNHNQPHLIAPEHLQGPLLPQFPPAEPLQQQDKGQNQVLAPTQVWAPPPMGNMYQQEKYNPLYPSPGYRHIYGDPSENTDVPKHQNQPQPPTGHQPAAQKHAPPPQMMENMARQQHREAFLKQHQPPTAKHHEPMQVEIPVEFQQPHDQNQNGQQYLNHQNHQLQNPQEGLVLDPQEPHDGQKNQEHGWREHGYGQLDHQVQHNVQHVHHHHQEQGWQNMNQGQQDHQVQQNLQYAQQHQQPPGPQQYPMAQDQGHLGRHQHPQIHQHRGQLGFDQQLQFNGQQHFGGQPSQAVTQQQQQQQQQRGYQHPAQHHAQVAQQHYQQQPHHNGYMQQFPAIHQQGMARVTQQGPQVPPPNTKPIKPEVVRYQQQQKKMKESRKAAQMLPKTVAANGLTGIGSTDTFTDRSQRVRRRPSPSSARHQPYPATRKEVPQQDQELPQDSHPHPHCSECKKKDDHIAKMIKEFEQIRKGLMLQIGTLKIENDHLRQAAAPQHQRQALQAAPAPDPSPPASVSPGQNGKCVFKPEIVKKENEMNDVYVDPYERATITKQESKDIFKFFKSLGFYFEMIPTTKVAIPSDPRLGELNNALGRFNYFKENFPYVKLYLHSNNKKYFAKYFYDAENGNGEVTAVVKVPQTLTLVTELYQKGKIDRPYGRFNKEEKKYWQTLRRELNAMQIAQMKCKLIMFGGAKSEVITVKDDEE